MEQYRLLTILEIESSKDNFELFLHHKRLGILMLEDGTIIKFNKQFNNFVIDNNRLDQFMGKKLWNQLE